MWNWPRSQTIAVLDSGVDGAHPDLSGRVYSGWDVLANRAGAVDDNGHGTMVAGIIAANTNNSRGIAGVAWNARLLAVKVLDSEGVGSDTSVVAGINWAASHGARVINLSLGGPHYNAVMHDAVKRAVAKGIVVVASSGNDYDSVPNYPAALAETVSVGATDNNGALTTFSSWRETVDLTAPGWNIVSTLPRWVEDPAYGVGSGPRRSPASPSRAGTALPG